MKKMIKILLLLSSLGFCESVISNEVIMTTFSRVANHGSKIVISFIAKSKLQCAMKARESNSLVFAFNAMNCYHFKEDEYIQDRSEAIGFLYRNTGFKVQSCPAPPPISHGKLVSTSGRYVGAKAVYSCDVNYSTCYGWSTRTCLLDGSWSGHVECKRSAKHFRKKSKLSFAAPCDWGIDSEISIIASVQKMIVRFKFTTYDREMKKQMTSAFKTFQKALEITYFSIKGKLRTKTFRLVNDLLSGGTFNYTIKYKRWKNVVFMNNRRLTVVKHEKGIRPRYFNFTGDWHIKHVFLST